jgi:hypothetical protein
MVWDIRSFENDIECGAQANVQSLVHELGGWAHAEAQETFG